MMLKQFTGITLFTLGMLLLAICFVGHILNLLAFDPFTIIGSISGVVLLSSGMITFSSTLSLRQFHGKFINLWKMLVAIAAGILFAVSMGEALIRLFSTTRPDGEYVFLNRTYFPHDFLFKRVEYDLNQYLASQDSITMYSSTLGWVYRPNSVSNEIGIHINAAGIRSDREYSLENSPDTLRIALFGDSFTAGVEAQQDETWGYLLEDMLTERGYSVEVLNFGVGGYGIDQALLRFEQDGRSYSPDFVILGFQAENMFRNTNLLRHFYYPESRIPFFKPRFVLEDGVLRLVDSPTPPLNEIMPTLRSFNSSDLRQYEGFFDPDIYVYHWWQSSRLLLFLNRGRQVIQYEPPANQPHYYDLRGDKAQLSLAIIEAFHDTTTAAGAKFVIVHLPNRNYFGEMMSTQTFGYADMLDVLDDRYDVIHPEAAFDLEYYDHYFEVVHYSLAGNTTVAEAVTDYFTAYLENSPDSASDQ